LSLQARESKGELTPLCQPALLSFPLPEPEGPMQDWQAEKPLVHVLFLYYFDKTIASTHMKRETDL